MKTLTTRSERELAELEAHIRKMFADAKRQGLHIGVGRDPGLTEDEQEGPMVKKLRELVGAKP